VRRPLGHALFPDRFCRASVAVAAM
jgi:hypothetical protein